MNDKSVKISEFLNYLHESNCNSVNSDNGLECLIGADKAFSIVCNKCGSLNVEVIGEKGYMVSEITGWQAGCTVFNCKDCETSATAWGG